jgi:hypothetical protein
MKTLVSPNLLALALAAVLSQTARAQYTANDLILGFTQSGAQNDYIIDLGNANTAVGANGSTLVDLSSLVNPATFNGTFAGGLANGVAMGVVGGDQSLAGRDVYITSLRSAIGTPSVPGSTAPASLASTPMSSGVGDLATLVNGLQLSPGGSATPAQAAANSWSTLITSVTPPSFEADTGRDPTGQATESAIYEDLYRGTPGAAMTYLGYFTFDTTSGASFTFTPSTSTSIPEPSTCMLVAAAGILVLAWRRRFSSKQA